MKRGTKPNQTRIGEQKIMKNGLLATIVGYRNNYDIDVEFEDGVVAQHKKYSLFVAGSIGYPKCNNHKK